MNPFDPLAAAHDAFWSFFARGPAGLAAQFFVDPLGDSAAPEAAATRASSEALPEVLPEALPILRAPVTGAPQWLDRAFVNQGETHRYKLYIPSAYAHKRLPLVVMLHGAQQDADDFAAGTGMNAAAEAGGFIVVYPEQAESANAFRCWNWFRPADQSRESGETAMVAALTREIIALCHVDPARVYVAGMSAGGAMAVNLTVTHPDLYAAAAIHSGMAFGVADEPFAALCAMNDGMGQVRLPVASSAASCSGRPRAVPLIVFHGDADDTVHPRNGDQIVAMSRELFGEAGQGSGPAQPGIEINPAPPAHAYTRHVFEDAGGLPVGEQWRVHGLGHAWSGGHADGTHTDARGPDATREIVRFFSQFALEIV